MNNKLPPQIQWFKNNHFFYTSWFVCPGRAQLADLLFHGALMGASRRYLPGWWAHSFPSPILCWNGLKTGLHWDCQLERPHLVFPCGGPRVVRLITGPLRTLRVFQLTGWKLHGFLWCCPKSPILWLPLYSTGQSMYHHHPSLQRVGDTVPTF